MIYISNGELFKIIHTIIVLIRISFYFNIFSLHFYLSLIA